jgi:lipid II isoglutaminyl synthase (glutamine-hydrolysing)
MKFYFVILLAKLIKLISKLLNIGSGYTWPGHVVLKLYPDIFKHPKFKFPYGHIFISGTNGKTTTAKLVTHLLEESGLNVVHNKTGANLLNGIASELALSTTLWGKAPYDVGVFEVDEYALPHLLKDISPNVLVLLNLSRDQLDRYGEVDLVLERWLASIKELSSSTEIVLDATQPYFNAVKNNFEGEITYFDDSKDYLGNTSLVGSFNARNINASVFVGMLLGFSEDELLKSLKDFTYAYGRGETIDYKGKAVKVLLAKNPASFNTNLDCFVSKEIEGDSILFILNDNIPDGRDVSWIYDIDQELLKESCRDKKIFVTGTRYLDMAIRLHYAGVEVPEENINSSLNILLTKITNDNSLNSLIALPNYSAMLSLRKKLSGKAIL